MAPVAELGQYQKCRIENSAYTSRFNRQISLIVSALTRLRRGSPPRWSITAEIPLRSIPRRIRRICRGVTPMISAAATQLGCRPIALVITSRRVIALASRATRRSMFPIARLYSLWRTSLNAYDPDIFSAYHNRLHDRLS